jgi:hypothetical protein
MRKVNARIRRNKHWNSIPHDVFQSPGRLSEAKCKWDGEL